MPAFQTRALNDATWPDFAGLVERHGGIWGGCWCLSFHAEAAAKGRTAARNRDDKAARVQHGAAHAALVYAGADCVGWCQFGSPEELPRIKSKRAYLEGLDVLPDWRITCFFTDKARRGQGVAAAALAGALSEIAALGGGRVESYPEDTEGRSTPAAFLHNGSLALFEHHGFRRDRRIGKHRWVVTREVR